MAFLNENFNANDGVVLHFLFLKIFMKNSWKSLVFLKLNHAKESALPRPYTTI